MFLLHTGLIWKLDKSRFLPNYKIKATQEMYSRYKTVIWEQMEI